MVLTRRRSSRLQSTPQAQKILPSDTGSIGDTGSRQFPSVATLPSLSEHQETSDIQPISNTSPLATPSAGKKTLHFFTSITTRTPKNRTPLVPGHEEMHPHHHHTSTAKPLDEARWLGFLNKGAHTEPPKGAGKLATIQVTPTKAREDTKNPFVSPDFKFTFKRQSLELSPEARKIMAESREEAAKIRAQMVAKSDDFHPASEDLDRKIATPKGKVGRFSDVHMAEFKKMDSIANHPSAFRADPNRFKSTTATMSLKRTQSKAELDGPTSGKTGTKPAASNLSGLNTENFSPAKRVKHQENDDTSTARPVSRDDTSDSSIPSTPEANRLSRPMTGIPRPPSTLTTPTKASIARSQSVKSFKTTMIPSLIRSPSTRSLAFQPASRTPKTAKSRSSLLKSILRTPRRLYSDDPAKVAAGTHLATPKAPLNLNKELPSLPATAPVCKHVDFTASTVEKHTNQQSALVGFQMPAEASRGSQQESSSLSYPALPTNDVPLKPNASRRTTLADMPGDFTFRSDHSISFGTSTAGTIRRVRNSDGVILPVSAKKRTLESVEEASEQDKENEDQEDEGQRPAKRAKAAEPDTPKAMAAKMPPSRLPTRRGKRPSGLSQARLNMLAMPKRRKA